MNESRLAAMATKYVIDVRPGSEWQRIGRMSRCYVIENIAGPGGLESAIGGEFTHPQVVGDKKAAPVLFPGQSTMVEKGSSKEYLWVHAEENRTIVGYWS